MSKLAVTDLPVGTVIITRSSQALATDNGHRFVDGVEKWRGKARGKIVSMEKTPGGVTYYKVEHGDGAVLGYWHTDIDSWEDK